LRGIQFDYPFKLTTVNLTTPLSNLNSFDSMTNDVTRTGDYGDLVPQFASTLGIDVKDWRTRLNLSQPAAAEALGMSLSTFRRVEKVGNFPYEAMLRALMEKIEGSR